MIFYFIILVLTVVSWYVGIKKRKKSFEFLGFIGILLIGVTIILPKEVTLKDKNVSVISAEQFNEIASVSSVDVKAHESNKSYIKKTTYTVSKKSKIYFITGHRELDTKYDVYIKK